MFFERMERMVARLFCLANITKINQDPRAALNKGGARIILWFKKEPTRERSILKG